MKATVGQTGQKALRRNGDRGKRKKKASIMSLPRSLPHLPTPFCSTAASCLFLRLFEGKWGLAVFFSQKTISAWVWDIWSSTLPALGRPRRILLAAPWWRPQLMPPGRGARTASRAQSGLDADRWAHPGGALQMRPRRHRSSLATPRCYRQTHPVSRASFPLGAAGRGEGSYTLGGRHGLGRRRRPAKPPARKECVPLGYAPASALLYPGGSPRDRPGAGEPTRAA